MTIALIVRATLLLTIGLAAAEIARRRTAAFRHLVLVAAMSGTLLLPFAQTFAPSTRVPLVRRSVIPTSIAAAPPAFATIRARVAEWESATRSRPTLPWTIVWLAGVTVFLARLVRSWCAALRIRRKAKGMFSADLDAPATIGLFRPVILLPQGMSDAAKKNALLHERAHVDRKDGLTRLIADIASAVYWFHPLMWIASRRAVLEQERACDDAALAGGASPEDYAQLLLGAARRNRTSAVLSMNGGQLEQRLRTILRPNARRGGVTLLSAITTAAIALTATSLVAGARLSIDALYDDPAIEELPDVSVPQLSDFASWPDRDAIASLVAVATRPKKWRGDLVAQRARWALAHVRDGSLVVPMRESLLDPDWRVRAYAAWSIAIVRDRGAVPRLIELTYDPIWRMRAMAVFALAEIGDRASSDAMRLALGDDAWQVRVEAVRYFTAFDDADSRALVKSMRGDRHQAVRMQAQ